MNPRTVLTLADGRNIDLVNPIAADYTPLAWAAEHLAKENRYNGATPGITYSVAQHLAEGVRVILDTWRDIEIAAYWSLHDVAEAVLKDDTTPKKRALAAIAEEKFGVLAPQVMQAFDELTERHDRAVHEAAGLAWPMPPAIEMIVKRVDQIMLVTEWRDLMGVALPNAEAYADVQPLTRVITPFQGWRGAQQDLLRAWRSVLPNKEIVA